MARGGRPRRVRHRVRRVVAAGRGADERPAGAAVRLATGVAGAGEEGIAALRSLLLERAGGPRRRRSCSAIACPARRRRCSTPRCAGRSTSVMPSPLACMSDRPSCRRRWPRPSSPADVPASTFLSAIAVGVEVGSRFNLTERMYDGFDPTGIAAVWGASASGGSRPRADSGADPPHARPRLQPLRWQLPEQHRRLAGGAACSRGSRRRTASSARSGPQRGLTGPVNFLSGTYSFTHLYAKDLCRPGDFVAGLGERWLLADFLFKRFPSCGVTQGVTEQALDVAGRARPPRRRRGPDRGAGCRRTRIVSSATTFVAGANPRVSAQFSVKYCVASAIARQRVDARHVPA